MLLLFLLLFCKIFWNMGKEKDQTTSEKQKIIKWLGEAMYALEISKKRCRDYWTIKKAVENISLKLSVKVKA